MISVASCRMFTPSHVAAVTVHRIVPRPRMPSVLIVIMDGSPLAREDLRALLIATARATEQIIVLSQQGGAVLASSAAPTAAGVAVPSRPGALPSDATSFQKSRYESAVRQYQVIMRRAQATLERHDQQALAAWAASVAERVNARLPRRQTDAADIRPALNAASANLSSMNQIGVDVGDRKVIVILGDGIMTAARFPADLQGSTVVIDDVPGGGNDAMAWQAGLIQAGAARAVTLVSGTRDQLVPVVRQGLDGSFADTLTSVLFSGGKAALRPNARPQLRHLLQLLTVTFPRAVASIDGYTDDLPVPGGNLALSERRARAVETWLVAHGVSAARLQSAGFGDSDPIATNMRQGQPLNRRVVVIIDPVANK